VVYILSVTNFSSHVVSILTSAEKVLISRTKDKWGICYVGPYCGHPFNWKLCLSGTE